MEVKPYQVNIADSVLADLKDRLERTRWPGEIPDSGWDYGSNLGYVKELVDYWRDGFDWRAREEAINAVPHFRATVQDLDIHFIHQRGSGPNPLPLVVTHGWPSTFFELMKIIPLLTDPACHGGSAEDSFDVVVPSMPGYGFSQPALQPGMSEGGVRATVHRRRRLPGRPRPVAAGRGWVFPHPGHQAPNPILWLERFPGGSGSLDSREVPYLE